jgi:spore coat polysaccharide biosynthesis protein SpsF (cytidylyltransferase family)
VSVPDIGVFSFGRMQSQRCPNKMLRPFGDTTLTDIVLGKLAAVQRAGWATFYAGHEDQFADRAKAHGVPFVRRSLHSVTIDGPIVEILGFLREVPHDWVLLISGCLPFLRVETILGFLDARRRGPLGPAFSVRGQRHHFVDEDRKAVNFDIAQKTLNTKAVRPLYELVDALYFFDRKFFLREGRYWEWSQVEFVAMPEKYELLDIDTEEDFRVAEAVWRATRVEVR